MQRIRFHTTKCWNQDTWLCVSGQESRMVHKWVLQELLTRRFQPLVSLQPLSQFLSNSHILCPPYMQLYKPNLKNISKVVCKICVPENCPTFFTFFFFALFHKSNHPKTPYLWIDFFQILHTYKVLCGLSLPKLQRCFS